MAKTEDLIPVVLAIVLVAVLGSADACLKWRAVLGTVKSFARRLHDSWRSARTCFREKAGGKAHCARSQRRLEFLRVRMLEETREGVRRFLRFRFILPPAVVALAALRAAGSQPETDGFDISSPSPMWCLSLLYMLCFVVAHFGLINYRGSVTVFTLFAQACFAVPFALFGDVRTLPFAAFAMPLTSLTADPVVAGILATLYASVMVGIYPNTKIVLWVIGVITTIVGTACWRREFNVRGVGKLEADQSKRLRRSMDCFLTTSYDALVQLDPELRIMEESMRFSNLAMRGAHHLAGTCFLTFVREEDRDELRNFVANAEAAARSEAPAESMVALTMSVWLPLPDETQVRVQLYHCLDESIESGLSHWLGLREIDRQSQRIPGGGQRAPAGSFRPGGHSSREEPEHGRDVGRQLEEASHHARYKENEEHSSTEAETAAVGAHGFDGFSHRAVSEQSSVSGSSALPRADFLDLCSMTLFLDAASLDDLQILSVQADLRPDGASPSLVSAVGMRDLMVTEDWNRMREWFSESRVRLRNGEDPASFRNVTLSSIGAGVTWVSTEAALTTTSTADHDANIFALTLQAPLAMPMSSSQRRAMRRGAMSMTTAGAPSPRVLGRIDEHKDDDDVAPTSFSGGVGMLNSPGVIAL
eukprot:TRINITY_DN8019_c0_g2_i9.p1 TRINITY_DN8019_c0_g2~~TRINITY_DN8019_c0_g2_i9.p1  ORF type:complete len:682 (-),score=67.94 TRINITY_DN8019_c0_g2_i9:808-2745(-)